MIVWSSSRYLSQHRLLRYYTILHCHNRLAVAIAPQYDSPLSLVPFREQARYIASALNLGKRIKSFDDIQKWWTAHSGKEAGRRADVEQCKERRWHDDNVTTELKSLMKRHADKRRCAKNQKVDDDKETAELKSLMKVMPDEEEVALDAIPLVVKSPSIVDWKIHKEGKKSYYQIIRADGSLKMYLVFSHMLKSFDREDLKTLYKLVKVKYGSTRPMEDLDLVLYGDLKTMFEPHVENSVWKNQSDYRVLDWKLYDSCGVHSLRMQNVHIHMLVEKRYPLTAPTITDMLNKKLILLVIMKLLMKKLDILKKNIKFRGGLLRLKAFLKLLLIRVNAASIKVTTAQRLRLLKEFLLLEEKG
ncbi:hypothetical protein Tco_0427498 [Tanacetum coccineum]